MKGGVCASLLSSALLSAASPLLPTLASHTPAQDQSLGPSMPRGLPRWPLSRTTWGALRGREARGLPAVPPGESGSPGACVVRGCWNAPPRAHLWPPASALALCVSAHPTPGHPHGSVSPCCGLAGMETHIDLLGGERPNAHACGVGLHHAVDLAYVLWGNAQARAHAAHSAIGGRHKGVGPCKTASQGLPATPADHAGPGLWLGRGQWPAWSPAGRKGGFTEISQAGDLPKSISRSAALAPSTRIFFGVPWSASYIK